MMRGAVPHEALEGKPPSGCLALHQRSAVLPDICPRHVCSCLCSCKASSVALMMNLRAGISAERGAVSAGGGSGRHCAPGHTGSARRGRPTTLRQCPRAGAGAALQIMLRCLSSQALHKGDSRGVWCCCQPWLSPASGLSTHRRDPSASKRGRP